MAVHLPCPCPLPRSRLRSSIPPKLHHFPSPASHFLSSPPLLNSALPLFFAVPLPYPRPHPPCTDGPPAPTMPRPHLRLLLLLLSLPPLVLSQTACRDQTLPSSDVMTMSLTLRATAFTSKSSPAIPLNNSRSIVRCASTVEVLSVPEQALAYEDVPLSAIVTIVETDAPLTEASEIEQQALPACSGIFVSPTQIMSSAHCVYHQRRNEEDDAFWMYGNDRTPQTYLYAIAGKVSATDTVFTVYPLQRACIPQSYIDAENEVITSGQGNDLVIFSTTGSFSGPDNSIGTFTGAIPFNMAREYLLMQYPSDVEDGERLVIDWNVTPIVFEDFMGGTFYSVDLASWSGSSGGPVVDVAETRVRGRPVVVGVLMSSGWSVCDSGIVPVTRGMKALNELMAATDGIGGSGGGVESGTGMTGGSDTDSDSDSEAEVEEGEEEDDEDDDDDDDDEVEIGVGAGAGVGGGVGVESSGDVTAVFRA